MGFAVASAGVDGDEEDGLTMRCTIVELQPDSKRFKSGEKYEGIYTVTTSSNFLYLCD